MPSAFRNRRVREVHALPLGWRHLTSVDIAQIKALVIERATGKVDLRTLEACLLLWSSLTTGRHAANLLGLSLRIIAKGERLRDQPPGLFRRYERWSWWLPAAAPRGQRRDKPLMHPSAAHVYLPATRTVAELVERCVAVRRSLSAGHEHLSGTAQPLFATGNSLIGDVTDMLASRHPAGTDRARRATTTAEALTRWLPAELIGVHGGDVVPASIITGHVPAVARTPVYYGAVPHRTLVDRYREAVGSIDTLSHQDVPGEVLATHLGDRRTPTDDAVRRLADVLADDLIASDIDAAEQHHAMMRYTVAMLSFAIAHRGDAGTMPAAARIHPETRFCWIRDKVLRGRASRRLVWICDTAYDQLHRYDRHLDALQRVVSPVAAYAIGELRGGRDLPLFDLRQGAVEPWTTTAAIKDAMGSGGLPKNAGRHWLRAKLVGRCSTETLHAFYGHGPVDDGSWDRTGSLDPGAYRADLGRVLDPVLADIGWTPRSSDVASMA